MEKTLEDILDHINNLFETKKLKVAFIRLGKGVENQKAHIKEKRFYIGYNSHAHSTFAALKAKDLSSDDFCTLVKNHGGSNQLAPSALKVIYEDNSDTLWFTIIEGLLYYGFTDGKKTLSNIVWVIFLMDVYGQWIHNGLK